MSIPLGCVGVAMGWVGEGCRACVCSLCCWGRGVLGPLWSVVVCLLCASFSCVFLYQEAVWELPWCWFWWGWVGLCVMCVFGVWEGGKVVFNRWGCVSVMWSGGAVGCAVCAACVSIHVSILMSGACPSIWHLSTSDKPGASVVPRWYPMRCSLIASLGSVSVPLW
jgi:hypothetical protein